jgi:Calcineurin-like phosphoesterase
MSETALIVGDTHGNLRWWHRVVIPTALGHGVDSIYQVGDFGYWEHTVDGVQYLNRLSALLHAEGLGVQWLDGNHENHQWLRKLYVKPDHRAVKIRDSIVYLPRGCRWMDGGVRFLACGGAYSVDKAYRIPGESWWPEEMITDHEVRRCRAAGRAEVLLCHDAPDGFEVQAPHKVCWDPPTIANRQQLLRVFNSAKPKVVFHGHWHLYQLNHLGDVPVYGLAHDTGDTPAMALLRLPSLEVEVLPR